MSKDQIAAKIEELTAQLDKRGNQLVAADPLCQNLIGQITAYRAMLKPPEAEGAT